MADYKPSTKQRYIYITQKNPEPFVYLLVNLAAAFPHLKPWRRAGASVAASATGSYGAKQEGHRREKERVRFDHQRTMTTTKIHGVSKFELTS